MKVRTDINEAVLTPPKNQKISINKIPQNAGRALPLSQDPQIVQSITSRINAERSLGEALSIAQASHSLLQKAMIISSQLRNMAIQAAATGKINQNDLGNVLSDINSSLNAYGTGVVGPVNAFIQPDADLPRLPGIENDIHNVVSVAEMFKRGEFPSRENIEEIIQTLANKTNRYDNFIQSTTEKMNILGNEYALMAELKNAASGDYSNMITANPAGAIAAQGNISSQEAFRILRA